MPDEFDLRPEYFVSHSRATKAERSRKGDEPEQGKEDEVVTHWGARSAMSLTIGKMPGQQLIIYNKRREVIQGRKLAWFQIWGLEPDGDDSIWRIEVRAGKRHLRDWNIRTLAHVETTAGEMFDSLLDNTRHVVPQIDDKNISRWPDSRLWERLRKDLRQGLKESFDGSQRGRVITGQREQIAEQYRRQILGLLPGALAASGMEEALALAHRGEYLRELAKAVERWEGPEFSEKLARARKRFRFI